jgi:hypothetical protein
MLGLKAQRRAYACLGFVKAPEKVEHSSEFVVRIGKVRLQSQCLAQACLGLLQADKIAERSAAIGPYLRDVAPDRERMVIAFQCFFVALAGSETATEFVPIPRASG